MYDSFEVDYNLNFGGSLMDHYESQCLSCLMVTYLALILKDLKNACVGFPRTAVGNYHHTSGFNRKHLLSQFGRPEIKTQGDFRDDAF